MRLSHFRKQIVRHHANRPFTLRSRLVASKARGKSDSSLREITTDESNTQDEVSFDFVCPICMQTSFKVSKLPIQKSQLSCPRCARSFETNADYVDLTVNSGFKMKVYEQKFTSMTEIFRSPFVSAVYERGWRQSFAWAGFPGVDREAEMALEYLKEAEGRILVDMSCGSGLFTRKFAASRRFAGVIAADFSETMLRQASQFLKVEAKEKGEGSPVVLLRTDVKRQPFATGSVAAIHAGAAIHCWENPQNAMAEISRVLEPGGVFVGSTFLLPTAPLGQILGDDTVRPLNQLNPLGRTAAYKFWEEDELRDLAASVGLTKFRCTRTWQFIMFAMNKPGEKGATY